MNDNQANLPKHPAVYPSAVDLWITVVLIISPVFAAGLGAYLWMDGNTQGATILLITAAATLLMTMAFVLPCRYTIEAEDLHVRCGILSYRIPLKTIQRVETTRTWSSGPALSLKRVFVVTPLKKHILSPRERDEFIAHLTDASACKRDRQGES